MRPDTTNPIERESNPEAPRVAEAPEARGDGSARDGRPTYVPPTVRPYGRLEPSLQGSLGGPPPPP